MKTGIFEIKKEESPCSERIITTIYNRGSGKIKTTEPDGKTSTLTRLKVEKTGDPKIKRYYTAVVAGLEKIIKEHPPNIQITKIA